MSKVCNHDWIYSHEEIDNTGVYKVSKCYYCKGITKEVIKLNRRQQ